ncbi:MAG: hypothetical protein HGA16_00175 [Candidatus Moranbacteria bacterium]|nr:hypothetical protein [Candidatus Moranbacteria bacterium]
MKMMMTKKLRVWFRVFDSVVILSMLLQPVAPAVIFSQEIPGDGASVATEASASTEAEAPKAEEKTAPVETKTEEVAAPVVEPVVVPAEEPKAEEPAAVVEPSTETAPVESAPVQSAEPTEVPVAGAVTPEVPAVPTVEAEGESSTEREPAAPEWKQNEDGSRTIAVSEGETYSYPDSGLKIKFTRIDADKNADNAREITVKEVKLSDAQVAELGALSDTAWDITSTMQDGSFEYSLTLPASDAADSKDTNVIFAENESDLSIPDKVGTVEPGDVSVDGSKNEVTAKSLDHFTVYVVVRTYSDPAMTIEHDSYLRGETVYAKGGEFRNREDLRIEVRNPSGTVVNWRERTNVKSIDTSYVLPSNAPTGTWTVKLLQKDGCNYTVKDTAEFTVTAPRFGTIVVHKDVTGPNGEAIIDTAEEFSFSLSGHDGADKMGVIRDGEAKTFDTLTAGTYTVEEFGIPEGYELVGISPDGNSHMNGAQVTVVAGQTVHVSIVNRQKPGKIVIVKHTVPEKGRGCGDSFTFDPSWSRFNFQLSDGQRRESGNLAAGTYSVRELATEGWDLTDVVCSDESAPDAISLQLGETVTCEFTNTKRAEITIKKDAIPDDSQDFTFTGYFGGEEPVEFSLDDDGNDRFSREDFGHHWNLPNERTFEVKPGIYSVSENPLEGWKQAGVECTGENDASMIVAMPGEHITCTFTNKKLAKITIVKKAVGGDGSFDFSLTGGEEEQSTTLSTEDGFAKQTFTAIDPDNTYGISEAEQAGWNQAGVRCIDEKKDVKFDCDKDGRHEWGKEDRGYGDDTFKNDTRDGRGHRIDPAEFTVNPGGEMTCTFTNTRDTGTITVNKLIDGDGNLETTDDQTPGSGWEFNVTGAPSAETGEDGSVSFSDLVTGSYDVTETGRSGYELLAAECSAQGGEERVSTAGEFNGEDGVNGVTVGNDVSCTFINAKLGLLGIEKENDATAPKAAGETVRYTLTIKARDGKVNDVSVTDLPPKVATYVPDSWTAESSLGSAHVGNLKLDHVYASPGIWDLGNLQDGEVITLSYDATVNAGTDAGEYPDLAYAQGVGQGGNLYAMAGLDGNIEDGRYVGTAIAVVDSSTPDPAKVTTDHTEKEKKIVKGRVLGATLPETGSPTFLIMLLGLLLILGAALAGTGYAIKKDMFTRILKKWGKGAAIFAFAMSLGFVATDTAKAGSVPDLYIRAEKPAVAANGSFTLDFVTLDTDQSGAITVKCQVKKPGDSDFTTFQTIPVQVGGNSGQCSVGSAELPDDGTYVFRVTATSGSEVATSKESTVSYDTIFPGKPKSIDKSYRHDCVNHVVLRTADDGQTSKVEVYRSSHEDFVADATTLVHTASVGPNATYAYDDVRPDALCGKKVFYAVRAFDDAGNASPVREEDISETNHVTVYEDTTAAGSVTLTPGAAGAGTGVEGAGSGSETVNGTVEGAQAGEQGAVEGAETASGGPNIWIWVIIAGAAAYGAYRWYIARKKGTPEVK